MQKLLLASLMSLLFYSGLSQNRILFNQDAYVVISNGAYLVIDNPNPNAITTMGTGGNIISEDEYNVVQWNIGSSMGSYTVPFTTATFIKIPLTIDLTAAGTGTSSNIIFSTYETGTDINTTYPSDVTNMNSFCNTDNSLYVVDRFWRIDAGSYTVKPAAIINFGYNDAANELVGFNTIVESKLKAERFNASTALWETPYHLFGIADPVLNNVSGVTVSPPDFHKSWTLVDTTIMTIPITALSASVCSNTQAILTPSGAATYTLMPGSLTSSTSFSIMPTINTTYTISGSIGTGTASCMSSPLTNATPTVYITGTPTVAISGATTICMGTSTTLTATANPAAGITYSWSPGNATTNTLNISPTANTDYTVTAYNNGCSSDTIISVSVVASTTPTTNFSYPSPICISNGNPMINLGTGFSQGGTFSSTNGLDIDSNTGIIDLANTLAGVYTVTYTVGPVGGCQVAGTGIATITINPTVTLTVSPNVTINVGESTTINSSSSVNTYTWFPATNLNCSSCNNPTASPEETTTYCVKTTDGVCSDSTCVTVTVEFPCPANGISFPNAFSPNGDGNNDQYCLQGRHCVSAMSFMIFDRWGEKIFETNDPTFCWDGTYHGQLLDPAVFVYYAKIELITGSKAEKKGNITLIK